MSLSNRQRKLVKKAIPTQRRGRPAVDAQGARYKCGKLKPTPAKPVEPNRVVVRLREALAGSLAPAAIQAAENPLSLAKHHGWISPQQYAAGLKFAEWCRTSGLDLPRMRTQDLDRAAKGFDERIGSAEAMGRLRKVTERLKGWPKASQALLDVCVMETMPAWIIDRLNGPARPQYMVARNHLIYGLNVVSAVLDNGGEHLEFPKLRMAAS